jgi:formate C-acetyltransferase
LEPDELIVGNRTAGVRNGVVSPEAAIAWIDKEIETLPTRPQDQFQVRSEDIQTFRDVILPYWKDKSMEDLVATAIGDENNLIKKVAKINQTDHPQGHICPDTEKWLEIGLQGLIDEAKAYETIADFSKKDFYKSVVIVLEASQIFIKRYARLAETMSQDTQDPDLKGNLKEVSRICDKIAVDKPETFHEAIQSMWFLNVILQLESNASSFSPGRADQYLYPYFLKDMTNGTIDLSRALEILEAIWLKFNQIVYMRSETGARYFAGFPIGFNIACGGQTLDGQDAANDLSYLFLKAQEHVHLPQPNLSARLFKGSSDAFVNACSHVISKGSGMPQIFNDEGIIPALMNQGIPREEAFNYAIVGCVELTTHGNNLGWSDAAMFNLVKALELTLNNGRCLLTGKKLGLATGFLKDYPTYEDLEKAFAKQLDHFINRMIKVCDQVDRLHGDIVPSPFLSAVIDGCFEKGMDVTAGGALYNLSGIQAIQVANLADSFATIKKLVYEERTLKPEALMTALQTDYHENEFLRQMIINKVPKYGNDVDWVDTIGNQWFKYFAKQLTKYTNARGGVYHTGLYTVSAHVPMGQNVGASSDGRHAKDPLADGGMSAMYGRDTNGPTALIKSVSKIDSKLGSNGTLLNMKFLPSFFSSEEAIEKFSAFLRTIIDLKINHVQFNVLNKEDLINAQEKPEAYKGLTVRVAGYTAYFTELASDLQDEIIARTSYGEL